MYSKSGKISNGILTNTFSNTIIYNFWKIHSVTIVANQSTLANVRKNKYFREGKITVKVSPAESEFAVKQTGSKTFTVSNADKSVTPGAVSVKRGTSTINTDSVVWDGDNLIITTSAKMSAATYIVTVGNDKAEVAVEDEKVVSIIVSNADDFVGVDNATSPTCIYVHYNVLNQFKEDVTAEAVPTWTSSSYTGNVSVTDPRNGLMEVPLNGSNWNYGSLVYLTGVYTKGTNVVTTQATVKVGMERAISRAEVLGVVSLTDKTVLENTIPVGFKSGKYVLAMQTYDQYGYLSDDLITKGIYNDVTDALNFISDAPLFIKSDFDPGQTITIDGEIYQTVKLEPGDYAAKGGTANIQIISKKLGTSERYEISTKDEQILTTFKIGNYTDIFADGETHEIPFTALDQNGEPITKYSVLNGQVTLNSSTGTDNLYLQEQNDGTAKLVLTDGEGKTAAYNWNGKNARDTVDRYVMLTSIITSNGNYSDSSLYIKDKAYPATITGLNSAVKSTVIEGGSTTVYLSGGHSKRATGWDYNQTFTYLDQYGREIVDTSWNGEPVYTWFSSSIAPKMQVTYTGNEFSITAPVLSGIANTQYINHANGAAFVFLANGSTNSTSDATMTFSLRGPKSISDTTEEVKGVSTKRIAFTLADINQATDFAVATKTMFVDTGVSGSNYTGSTNDSNTARTNDKYAQKIVVTGKVNGKEVIIPELISGGAISGSSITVSGSTIATSGNAINTSYYQVKVLTPNNTTGAGVGVATSGTGIYFKAVTTTNTGEPNVDDSVTQYTMKNFKDANTYPGYNLIAINNRIELSVWDTRGGSNPKAVVYSTLETRTNEPYATNLASKGEKQTLKPLNGRISTIDLQDLVAPLIYDQYGVVVAPSTVCDITISNVVENVNGLYTTGTKGSSIQIQSNGTPSAQVVDAERGDTFTVTFSYKNTIRVSVNVEVGADWAAISNDTDPSLWE